MEELGSAGAIWEHAMPQSIRSLLVTPGVFVGLAAWGNTGARPATLPAVGSPQVTQGAAVAAIEKLGGHVTFDAKNPDRPATGVKLLGPHIDDRHLVHLKA